MITSAKKKLTFVERNGDSDSISATTKAWTGLIAVSSQVTTMKAEFVLFQYALDDSQKNKTYSRTCYSLSKYGMGK